MSTRTFVAVVVTVVWSVSYLLAAFHGVSAPPELSGVMVAAITYLLGSGFRIQLRKAADKVLAATEEDEDGRRSDEAD